MRERVACVIVMVVLAAGRGDCDTAPGESGSGREIACESAVLAQAWQLLASAQFGRSRREHAAFIVRRGDGTLELERWPFEAETARATFRGSAPAGAVAIIHTHPNELPYPSTGDQRLASRLGLPVYVVTRTGISKTDGKVMETIWSGDWNPRFGGRHARSRCGEVVVEMTVALLSGNR